MGMAIQVSSPTTAYTKTVATCLGIGFYSSRTRQGALYHIAGAENSSMNALGMAVQIEVERLGSGIDVCFVSGMATIDPETQEEIRTAQAKSLEILDRQGNSFREVERHLCEPEEHIDYFSLDCESGKFSVRKGRFPRNVLISADQRYRELFG